jgi:hypothetical protein
MRALVFNLIFKKTRSALKSEQDILARERWIYADTADLGRMIRCDPQYPRKSVASSWFDLAYFDLEMICDSRVARRKPQRSF